MLSGKLFHSSESATTRFSSNKVINFLLTLTSSGPYLENIALSLSCADLASLVPYRKDLPDLRAIFSQYGHVLG